MAWPIVPLGNERTRESEHDERVYTSAESVAVTFEALCATAEALGIEVGIALAKDRYELTLVGFGRCSSVRMPVGRPFDAAATVLCCSLALARDVPGGVGDGVRLAASWPELAALAHADPNEELACGC